MADMKSPLADPRRRNLTILGGAALVSVLLATFAVYEHAAQVAPKTTPTEFFPGFAAHVRQAARIHIASKKGGTFDVVFKPSKGWVLPQKNDYPASFVEVNKTLVTLAAMQTIEPKTARPDWMHTIGLDAPAKGGDGVEIAVGDDHGHDLAHLIAGKSEDIGDASGAIGLFVRRPDETQSWLVRAEAEFQSDPDNWIDKNVIALDQAKIQSTFVDHPDGGSFEVSRVSNKDAHFKLSAMPAGRELSSEAAPDALAAALTDFAFDDVKPAKDLDFSNPIRTVTRTFDGLSITVDAVKVGADIWAELSAASLSNNTEIAKQARTINARANGWAFKLEADKGAQFTATLESLLRPKGAKPPSVVPQDVPEQP